MKSVKKIGAADNVLPTKDDVQKIFIYMRNLIDRYPEVINGYRELDSKYNNIDIGKMPEVDYFNKPSPAYLGFSSDLILIYRKWKYFLNSDEITEKVEKAKRLSEDEPVSLDFLGLGNHWVFKGKHYETEGPYTHDEFMLLILDEFDKERKKFEALRRKFSSSEDEEFTLSRPRIPEQVRIEVWRRDGGKCARCGSRINLEYDHIVPVSRGGSNTVRNIELLCEKCNRTKHNNIA